MEWSRLSVLEHVSIGKMTSCLVDHRVEKTLHNLLVRHLGNSCDSLLSRSGTWSADTRSSPPTRCAKGTNRARSDTLELSDLLKLRHDLPSGRLTLPQSPAEHETPSANCQPLQSLTWSEHVLEPLECKESLPKLAPRGPQGRQTCPCRGG